MISKERVLELINEKMEETDIFLVELTIGTANHIEVLIDADNGISIDKCIQMSRQIEHNLDREEEDFSLNVSSPGLDQPLKVHRQYLKNVGRSLKVNFVEEKPRIEGELIEADDEGIVLETKEKVRIEGRKKKELVVTQHKIKFAEIEKAKVVISFK